MEVEAAKLIGAGLATIGVAGSGAGIGTVFGAYVSDPALPICANEISLDMGYELFEDVSGRKKGMLSIA